MRRRDKVLISAALLAFSGVLVLSAATLWVVWRESVAVEQADVERLATRLGERTDRILADTRGLLAGFDRLDAAPCSPAHIDAMQQAAISRPYIRAIGYWRGADRQCSVGFLQGEGLKPPRADRIYPSGVIAWWPGEHTRVGGVPLFLMRFGDHDAAIDPGMLLGAGEIGRRQAGLWVEGLRLASVPSDAELPVPPSVPIGLSVDSDNGRLVSRYSHDGIVPIDIVATEPIAQVWGRHAAILAGGLLCCLLLVAAWVNFVLRHSRRRLSLASELGQAIASGAIGVQYQPIVELASGRCIGAEALARWQRESGESVPPDVFIPIAEAAGLLPAVTLSVLRVVLADLPALRERSADFSVSLNLAAEDLAGGQFADRLAAALAAAELPPQALKLEITERALVDSERSRTVISHLRARGHEMALDDFGTGYSSLGYLQSFELDWLKIDKLFVDAIGRTGDRAQVIGHVIDMAASLRLDTVAEGIEQQSQFEWLLERGVVAGQGYLFSRPLWLPELLEFIGRDRDRPHAWRGRPTLVHSAA